MAASQKILIVDDEPDSLEYLRVLLLSEGFRVTAAASGAQALELIDSEPPDLIICDLMMPGMAGLDLCAQLREHERARGIPIIVWSAHPVGHSNAGLYDHAFMKGIDLDELVAMIRALLSKPRSPA